MENKGIEEANILSQTKEADGNCRIKRFLSAVLFCGQCFGQKKLCA